MYIKTLLCLFAINFSVAMATTQTADLRFSNTQKFDQWLFRKISYPYKMIKKEDADKITITDPSSNDSAETKKDLDQMMSYKKLRTPKKIKEIKQQRQLVGEPFCHIDLLELSPDDPILDLIVSSLGDGIITLLTIKNKYDRVRPHFLRPEIQPIISVPRHPAYPSGHSTESHLVAYILSEVDPQYKDCFVKTADNISKNREIAGLHYPSDSAGGVELATKLMELFKASPEWNKKLEAAKVSYQEKKSKMLANWNRAQK